MSFGGFGGFGMNQQQQQQQQAPGFGAATNILDVQADYTASLNRIAPDIV
jgi:hypothetical protein